METEKIETLVSRLRRVTSLINRAETPQALAAALSHEDVARMVPFDYCSLVLPAPEGTGIHVWRASRRSARERLEDARVAFEAAHGELRRALSHGSSLLIPEKDLQRSPSSHGLGDDARSALALPLTFGGECFGLLCFASRRADTFAHDDVERLRWMADVVAAHSQAILARTHSRTLSEKLEEIEDRAELAAEDKLLELLVQQGVANPAPVNPGLQIVEPTGEQKPAEAGPEPEESAPPVLVVVAKSDAERQRERDRLRQQFREGRLDDRMVEVETRDRGQPQIEILSNQPPEDLEGGGLRDMLSGLLSQRTRKRQMKAADAFEYLVQEEEGRLLDMDQVTRIAVERVEDSGIVFLDEIDKIAGREGGHGPDISREGVQRDILPIVEGTTVNTKYGFVATDHILFIAAGAFHVSKPSDLIPELQGRFPIRVELLPLTVEDFLRILTEPRASLTKQSIALLETEGLRLEFAPEALEEMARFAFEVNETTENIGARRLHTIMEKVLDEISFQAPDLAKGGAAAAGDNGAKPGAVPELQERTNDKGAAEKVLLVSREYVQQQVAGIVKNQDLSRYIL
jgi:ATP-dependent HslUV protease ATP-binding subunit HslU